MNNSDKVILCVAPNGARKTKSDHNALPITPLELAEEAANCLEAGASMIHLHVRDEDDKHTILSQHYRPALQAIKDRLGDDLIVQITTEAVGMFTPDDQIAAVKELKPEAVSLALKELCPEGGEDKAKDFFHWVHGQGISAQYILYSADDVSRFIQLHQDGIIPDKTPSILLVLGRYSATLTSEPDDLLPMLDAMGNFKCIWAVCAFGPKEHECMKLAVEKGGHCRIGFENNMQTSTGELAESNASLIAQFAKTLSQNGQKTATADDARHILNMKQSKGDN